MPQSLPPITDVEAQAEQRWTALLWLLFGVALAVRLVAVLLRWPVAESILTPLNDSTDYHVLAESLLAGSGFAGPSGEPTAFRPPFYPVFLAVIYSVFGVGNLGAVAVVQAFLGAFHAVLLAAAARRWKLGATAGLLAGAAAALYPAFVFQTAQILTEITHRVLQAGAFYMLALLFERGSKRAGLWAPLAGVVFVVAVFSKSVLLAALPFMGVLVIWRCIQLHGPGRGAWLSLAALLPIALGVGAWTARNAVASGGEFVPVSSNFPITFAQGVTRFSFYSNKWSPQEYLMPVRDDYLILTQMRSYEDGITGELATGEYYAAQARAWIGERPGWFAWLTTRKALHFWGPFIRNSPAAELLALASMGPVLLLGWAGLLWALRNGGEVRWYGLMALALALPVTLPYAISQPDVRYRLGLVDPLWMMLAGYAVVRLAGWFQERRADT